MELALWMTWHEQAALAAVWAREPRIITYRRLAGPAGRVNPKLHLPLRPDGQAQPSDEAAFPVSGPSA